MYVFDCNVVVIEKRKKKRKKEMENRKRRGKSFIETQWFVGV